MLEARAAKLLSVQAKAMPSHVAVKSAWTVRKVEYNGGEVFFEKNMMNVKDEEVVVVFFQQKMTFRMKTCCSIA